MTDHEELEAARERHLIAKALLLLSPRLMPLNPHCRHIRIEQRWRFCSTACYQATKRWNFTVRVPVGLFEQSETFNDRAALNQRVSLGDLAQPFDPQVNRS